MGQAPEESGGAVLGEAWAFASGAIRPRFRAGMPGCSGRVSTPVRNQE